VPSIRKVWGLWRSRSSNLAKACCFKYYISTGVAAIAVRKLKMRVASFSKMSAASFVGENSNKGKNSLQYTRILKNNITNIKQIFSKIYDCWLTQVAKALFDQNARLNHYLHLPYNNNYQNHPKHFRVQLDIFV